ncbi:hypothetical protein FGO68_gene4216 [Halteria grandinella]|uniref:Uncharacterized protein n=1 Tax=Halteria grandinella TaxID=5974 RepID=A0A8J8T417_HALGN|nr:hypothetical protein FGO68_gene4216 [Halteria grandinella]
MDSYQQGSAIALTKTGVILGSFSLLQICYLSVQADQDPMTSTFFSCSCSPSLLSSLSLIRLRDVISSPILTSSFYCAQQKAQQLRWIRSTLRCTMQKKSRAPEKQKMNLMNVVMSSSKDLEHLIDIYIIKNTYATRVSSQSKHTTEFLQ